MKVTDIEFDHIDSKTKKIEKRIGYYMDGYLAENLAGIPNHLKKDWDVIGIVSGRNKVRLGKCFGKETRVKIFKDGQIKDSKFLGSYKDGEILKTVSWDFSNNKIVESESRIIINNDKRKLYIVELENGKKIRCSMDHKLFVKRKFCGADDKVTWKIVELKLKDMKIGDELVWLN